MADFVEGTKITVSIEGYRLPKEALAELEAIVYMSGDDCGDILRWLVKWADSGTKNWEYHAEDTEIPILPVFLE